MKKFEQFQDMIGRLYPETITINDASDRRTLSRTVTFQVTDECNLCCTYCYQINKGKRKMKFEDAKKLIDMLLTGDERLGEYVDVETSPGIIIEFIGGEPFLCVDLIDQICTYFYDKAIELMHPWATKFCISICSNGVLYFDPKVQKFLNKWRHNLSFSITIDGNKALHDACRVFPDGSGSYDVAVAGAQDWISRGYYMGSKITIAPGNVQHLFSAIKHMVELGYTDINANVVYEKGWTLEHAKIYYEQLKMLADYWLENDLADDHFMALFENDFFKPKEETDLENWCGGTGFMLAMDPDGWLYPCIRYMESSLGTSREPLRIGHVNFGIAQRDCDKKCVDCLRAIDRRTESSDECFYCPIAEGCSWCFPAGTKVSTPTGLRNIEDIKIGDTVLDWFGHEKKVYSNFEHTALGITTVKASGFLEKCVTNEHPFLGKKLIKLGHNKFEYSDPKWIPACELKTGDRIGLFVRQFGNKRIANYYFAYIIGRYVADGWKTPSNRNKHPFKYYLCSGKFEHEKVEEMLSKSGIGFNVSENKTVYEYNLHISDNEYLVNLLDDCGRYAKDKRVPNEIISEWDKESICAFLDGYFDGDGSISDETQRFTSTSYELILNISELVRMTYHKNVNITKREPNETSKIGDRTINNSVSYEGRFMTTDPERKYCEYDEFTGIMWVNVATPKENAPEEMVVYNLSVEDTHTYIADGAIVHNCSAYNYQENGTPDSRCTYICDMHKTRSLANAYFWNKYYRKKQWKQRFKIYCPDEWAIPIIGEEELNMLKELSKED